LLITIAGEWVRKNEKKTKFRLWTSRKLPKKSITFLLFHIFSHLNEDVRQCVIYDSPDQHGRLIGVEYIISAKLFEQLPPEEKKYWHSHAYEVCLKTPP
jgi:hypothetical protein